MNCYICENREPDPKDWFPKKCEKHDVCNNCGVKRKDLKKPPWGKKHGFICVPCENKRRKKAVDEFQAQEHDDFDFMYNDEIVCPWCGYKYNPEDTYDDCEQECPNCAKTISIEIEHHMTFSTARVE